MRKAAARRFDFISPSLLTRVLILAYFVVLACGLVDGAEISRLTAPFLPEPVAGIAAGAAVVTLSAFVLFGIWQRASALSLALMLFCASYLTILSGHGADLGAFWRDIALIAALVMSAGVGKALTLTELPPGSDKADLSFLGEGDLRKPTRTPAAQAQKKPRARVRTRTLHAGTSRLYREDLDAVRST